MNMDLAGNIYFTLGSYLLVYMLVGIASFGSIVFLIGRWFPGVRSAVSPARRGQSGARESKELRLAHESM